MKKVSDNAFVLHYAVDSILGCTPCALDSLAHALVACRVQGIIWNPRCSSMLHARGQRNTNCKFPVLDFMHRMPEEKSQH